MKLLKKTFALMLGLILVVGMIPGSLMTTYAAGTEITEAELFEQIEFTSAMINGSSIVNSNSSAFTMTKGTGWELKYSQSGTVLYFDLYLDNANINQVNFDGKLLKDSAYNVSFNVYVKGNCSISGLYVEIKHTDPKYQFGGEMANYSNMDVNIYYDSHNSTLDASNYIQLKGMYYVRLRIDNNGHTGNTLKCNYFDVGGTNWLSRIDMLGVNFIATRSGKGVVFNVYNCGIYFTNCNVLFNLAENIRPFQDGNNKISFSNEMVEYGGKVERIHVGIPGAEADYVDSNRYAAILKSENLAKYLKFTNQNPAMPSGNTETDITAILGNTETYQFNNAALPNWLAEGGFDVYRSWEHSKDGSTIVGNGNSADELMTYSYNYTNAGTYKFVEELTLKYFDETVSGAKKTHTFNITTTEGSGEGGGEETAEIDLVNVTVTEPEAGKTPAAPVVETENVKLVMSTWKEEGKTENATTFEAGKTYVLEVLVNPETDYDFAANPAVKINGKDATVTHSSPTAVMCSYKFAVPGVKEDINEIAVTVAEPEAGKTPAVPVVETENVKLVMSTWKEEGKTENATTFEAGKTYVLEVLVNPETGYDFAANPTVKINGKDATVTYKSSTSVMCSYKFAVPGEGGETPPTEYDITVTGGTASANKAVAGTSITLTAEQIDGKVFSHWEVNGATVSDANAKETTFTMGNADVTAEAIYDDCECKCHKGGIEGFFFKFVLFFQKIFGMNTVCGCQMKHNVFGDLW